MLFSQDARIRNWLPRLQSHRGYIARGARENSLGSVKAAFELGYEMAEFDVRLTSDNVCILFHDNSFNGKPVNQTTFLELNTHTEITKFEDLLIWFSGTREFKLNVEIKSRDLYNFELEKIVAHLISKYVLEKRIIISSFNPFTLFKIRLFCPQVYRAILVTMASEGGNNFFTRQLIFNFLCRPHAVHLRFNDFSDQFQRLAKKIPVVLWTVNDLSEYKKVREQVHGIISDDITPTELNRV